MTTMREEAIASKAVRELRTRFPGRAAAAG